MRRRRVDNHRADAKSSASSDRPARLPGSASRRAGGRRAPARPILRHGTPRRADRSRTTHSVSFFRHRAHLGLRAFPARESFCAVAFVGRLTQCECDARPDRSLTSAPPPRPWLRPELIRSWGEFVIVAALVMALPIRNSTVAALHGSSGPLHAALHGRHAAELGDLHRVGAARALSRLPASARLEAGRPARGSRLGHDRVGAGALRRLPDRHQWRGHGAALDRGSRCRTGSFTFPTTCWRSRPTWPGTAST